MTVLEHLVASISAAAAYNTHDAAPPSVILWPDGPRLWESVASRIGECIDRFYTLSPEVSGTNAGPSTWIRYHLGLETDKKEIPVIYLPGISRQAFRTPIGFPDADRHLFALQFLGQFWTQLNGKDWTPAALLSSNNGGLGLDLSKDDNTIQALATQLAGILDAKVSNFQGKRLTASDFNVLAVSDPAGMMLRWMSDPDKAKAEWPVDRMAAFQGICEEQYQFNPSSDGRLKAAELLVAGGGAWDHLWDRFEEAPAVYRTLKEVLALVRPDGLFSTDNPRLPQTNQEGEDSLRKALLALTDKPPQDVLSQLVKLALANRKRAASVWAQLGEAPLAQAAAHLGRMVEAMQPGMAGTDWDSLAKAYLSSGWHVDAEARRSFAAVQSKADMDAIAAAIRSAYLPWLEQQAQRVSAWAAEYPNPSTSTARHQPVEAGTVYLFVDGLRADVALDLGTRLESSGLAPVTTLGWAPLPTITASGKAGWQPFADDLCGEALSEKFEPQVAENGKALTTHGFRTRITSLGFVWFPNSENGDPSGCGWTETADFDSRGHEEGAKLAWRIEEELQAVRQRISELLQSGWKKVVVVTDHGWLWLPGGLPKTDLPAHLTDSKWSRCATIQPGAQHQLPTAPWFWANQHHVVLAPGVTAFRNGVEYSHGGLTLQEALTLTLTVGDSRSANLANVAITSVRWLGLRLNVEVQGATPEFSIDIRTKAADASSSLLDDSDAKQNVRIDGKASIIVANDDFVGTAATLVVLHAEEVVAKCPITIGEN